MPVTGGGPISSGGNSSGSNIPTTGIPGAIVGFDPDGNLVASADLEMLARSGAFGEGLSAKTATVEDNIQASDPDTGNACEMDPNEGLTFNSTNVTPTHLAGIAEADPSAETPLVRADNPGLLTEAQATILANTSNTNTGDQDSVSGNAGTATKLATARKINNTDFDGSGDIIVPGIILTDSQGNRPSASLAGREFVASDGYGPIRQIDNGSGWDRYFGNFKCTSPPAAAAFSIINGTYSSLTDHNGGLLYSTTGSGLTSEFNSASVVAIPGSGAYSLVVGMQPIYVRSVQYTGLGICLADGIGATPKLLVMFMQWGAAGSCLFNISKYTNPTTFSANAVSNTLTYPMLSSAFFMRIHDDRTNVYFYISPNGVDWVLIYSEGRTSFLTPAYAGLFQEQASTSVATSLIRSACNIFHFVCA